MHYSPNKGFTLIEVIIAMALIGILGTVMITLINPLQQFRKARDVERKSDLRQIQAALELYRADNAAYPASLPNCNISFTGTNGATYMQTMPCDPQSNIRYAYTLQGNGYTLMACLENKNDPDGAAGPCNSSNDLRPYTVRNP